MDWLYCIGIFLGIVGFAFFFGWAGKRVKSPVLWTVIGISLVLVVLWLEGWLVDALLLLALGLHELDHIPPFIIWVVLGSSVFLFFEYRFRVTAAAVLEVLAEVEKANARIELLESSVRSKLEDITSQLPKRDEPDYLVELRKEALRD